MGSFEAADWYDLPRYYDIVFEADTTTEAVFLERMMHTYGRSGGTRVLEPACGSGRLVRALARRGWTVVGFDRNPRMVSYAHRRVEKASGRARVVAGDLRSFSVRGRFDLAHCLVSTFKYLLTEADARAHLTAMGDALKPGGLYVLGFHLTDYDRERRTRERWVAARGGTRVTSNLQIWPADRRRRRERVRARLRVEDQKRTESFETHWWFRTYDARQVRRLLGTVPAFDCVATYDFTYSTPRPLDDSQHDLVLVLRRR